MEEESATSAEAVEGPAAWLEEGEESAARMEEEGATSAEVVEGPADWLEGGEESAARMEKDEPPPPPCHSASKLHKKSFIDDLTLLEKISLSYLIEKNRIIGPLTIMIGLI